MEALVSTPLPSPFEMAAWDRAAIAAGTPSLELMERAGRGVAAQVVALRARENRSGEVLILCGAGNNGGDGLVVARVLRAAGVPSRVVVAGAERYSDDFCTNALRLIEAGERIGVLDSTAAAARWGGNAVSLDEMEDLFTGVGIVVDALLGTGQREAPSGAVKTLVEMVGRRRTFFRVIAVDIPTGVNAANGAVYSPAITADITVAIQCIKRGLMQYPARERCGEIVPLDIGIEAAPLSEFALCGDDAALLPRREAAAHKGHFGHVTVIGGSASMPGAPILSASAALRMGAGWVSLGRPIDGDSPPEIMLVPLEKKRGQFEESDAHSVLEALKKSAAVVLGPGLGTSASTAAFLRVILCDERSLAPLLVIDADALNSLSTIPAIGDQLARRRVVITPHPGEAARLLGRTSEEIQADRFGAAVELHRRFNATVVLKGAGTIVYGAGRGFVCPFGTPYLATPGSGDVLAGMIAALGAQERSAVEAAYRAVVIHARSGEAAHRCRGGYLIASDIIDAFGEVVRFR